MHNQECTCNQSWGTEKGDCAKWRRWNRKYLPANQQTSWKQYMFEKEFQQRVWMYHRPWFWVDETGVAEQWGDNKPGSCSRSPPHAARCCPYQKIPEQTDARMHTCCQESVLLSCCVADPSMCVIFLRCHPCPSGLPLPCSPTSHRSSNWRMFRTTAFQNGLSWSSVRKKVPLS